MAIKSISEVVANEKSVTSKLPAVLSNALLVLKYGMEIPFGWEPNAGEQSVDLATLESKVNALESAFASKDKFDEKQLIAIRKGLIDAKSGVSKLVSTAMNIDGNKLRQGLKEMNDAATDRKFTLNVDTKDRVFRFSVEEKENNLDQAMAILKDAGITIPASKETDAKHAGNLKPTADATVKK